MTRAVGFSLTHSHSSRFPVPASFVPYFSLLVLCIAHPLFKSLDPALCSGPRSFVHPPPSPSFHLIYVHFVCIGWCCFSLLFFCFLVRRDTLRPAACNHNLQARAQTNKEKVCPSDFQQSFTSTNCVEQFMFEFCCSLVLSGLAASLWNDG